jgi:hypothetical protein
MHADVGSGLVPQIPHELDQFAVDHRRIAHFRSSGVEVAGGVRSFV